MKSLWRNFLRRKIMNDLSSKNAFINYKKIKKSLLFTVLLFILCKMIYTEDGGLPITNGVLIISLHRSVNGNQRSNLRNTKDIIQYY